MRITTAAVSSAHPTWMSTTLEVAGGIFTWPLDADDALPAALHVFSIDDATWLWRIVGEQAHVRVVTAFGTGPAGVDIDVDVELPSGATELALLHRLAWGHWLRRWWPSSVIDGIDTVSGAVLDVEVATLTQDCEAYFDDDAFDGDPSVVLAAHDDSAIDSLATHFSAEVRALHARWLRQETGVEVELAQAAQPTADDYALAAGPAATNARTEGIARGHASVAWESVPANSFDAAENTLRWSVDAAPDVVADIVVRLLPGHAAAPVRIELTLPDPPMSASGVLATDGTTRIPLPLNAAQAWRADWSTLSITVSGVAADDTRALRESVRELARRRIAGTDSSLPLFVAEQLIADADY